MQNELETKLTDAVIARLSHDADPRFRRIMQSLIRHVHDFVREVELTEEEWFEAIKFLTATGQKCDDKRQEFILLSDVLGVSMLVDAINHRAFRGDDRDHGARAVFRARREGNQQWRRHGGGLEGRTHLRLRKGAVHRRQAARRRAARPVAVEQRGQLRRAARRHRRQAVARQAARRCRGAFSLSHHPAHQLSGPHRRAHGSGPRPHGPPPDAAGAPALHGVRARLRDRGHASVREGRSLPRIGRGVRRQGFPHRRFEQEKPQRTRHLHQVHHACR